MGNYFLVSKTIGMPYKQYCGNAVRILKSAPATVDEIVIGIKNKAGKVNKLTTFRDADGNVIERCYDNLGKPFRNLVYSKYENIIGQDEYVESISYKEYSMPRKYAKKYREKKNACKDMSVLLKVFWKKIKSRMYHVSSNVNNAEKVISLSEINYNKFSDIQVHRISEYQHLLKGQKHDKEKKLVYVVCKGGHDILPDSVLTSDGVIFPEKDSYLPYRALNIEDSKLLLTQRAVKDRHLEDMHITIKPDYAPAKDEIEDIALFKSQHGDICFNKFKSYSSKGAIANTAYHETEHAWQYFLNARLSEGGTPWEDIVYFEFGPLKSKKQINEAKAYKKSINHYVPYDGTNYEKYMKNYIEIKAHQAGSKAALAYKEQGETIRKIFPHIPSELL